MRHPGLGSCYRQISVGKDRTCVVWHSFVKKTSWFLERFVLSFDRNRNNVCADGVRICIYKYRLKTITHVWCICHNWSLVIQTMSDRHYHHNMYSGSSRKLSQLCRRKSQTRRARSWSWTINVCSFWGTDQVVTV